ncbi:hypothetical protein EJ110_NYTH21646 [Nymphaea thermarum]|nr:hypothetical protein EJ110_NYTH21646 [Nymphaea thermarum]
MPAQSRDSPCDNVSVHLVWVWVVAEFRVGRDTRRAMTSFADLRTSEINAQVSEAYRLWLANDQQPLKVDMRKLLAELTFNVVARTMAGEDCPIGRGGNDVKAREFARCTREVVKLFTVFVASELFPFLEVLDIKGWIGTMKKVARELDAFIGRCRKKSTSDYRSHDFIDLLLSHFSEDEGANQAIKSSAMVKLNPMLPVWSKARTNYIQSGKCEPDTL